VCNQPDESAAQTGARNRALAAMQIASNRFQVSRAIGPESGVDTEWHDVSYVCVVDKDGSIKFGKDCAATVPAGVRRETISGDTTFGQLLREKYNLSSDDAWIKMDGGNRAVSFLTALRAAK
jgi:non-canonical (house-cleaning) NTP pyrophosphatase